MKNLITQRFRLKPDNFSLIILLLLGLLFLSACGGSGFHLRQNINLANKYQTISIQGLASENELQKAIEYALLEAGSQVSANAKTRIKISNLREGRRVVAYTSERKVREYLLFLQFDYSIIDTQNPPRNPPQYPLNLDQTFLYDANFVLGKTEEEQQIRKNLYKEAARLILLKIQ